MAVQEPSIDHLERLHTNFLFAIPSFFSSTSNDTKQKLLEVFAVILEQKYFKANLAWFVVWDKSIDEEYPKSYFLKGNDSKARQVVNMYKSSEWIDQFSKYVTIPSKFCVRNGIEDTSFIFAAEDFGVERVNNKYLVPLNLKDIVSEITMRDSDISRNMKHGLEEKVIKELEYYHSQLGENDNLITPIFKALKDIFPETAITKKTVAKLLNCYFWLGLAYPEDWKTMLYFPGIIAKKVESVPFGVNIGFKKTPSMDVILFLKKITLLFFTRKAVEFFERRVQKEKNLRMAMFREVYHDIGRLIIPSILKTISRRSEQDVIWLLNYLRGRLEFLRLLSIDEEKKNGKFFSIRDRINHIYERLAITSKNALKLIYSEDTNCKIHVHVPAFDLIFENLMSNSGRHGTTPARRNSHMSEVPVRIEVLERDDNIYIYYQDEGKGFEEDKKEEVNRWIRQVFNDDEITNDTGMGFSMIQKACNSIGGVFCINWGDIIDGRYKPTFKFTFPKGVKGV